MENYTFLLDPTQRSKKDLYWSDGKHLGFAELVDVMPRIVPKGRTGDVAIVQGARVSYGSTNHRSEKEDAGLIEYLVEHYHTSPLEMCEIKFVCCAPLFVFNQLVRHRTACITGDAMVSFVDGEHTLQSVYERFKKGMELPQVFRCNEMMGLIELTNVVDIWQTGVKEVYEVTLNTGKKIKTTLDHRFYTEDGWFRLEEAVQLKLAYQHGSKCKYGTIDEIKSVGFEMTYDMEVEGPHHNFVCNGFIVHNSVNCVSRRYTEIPEDSFYVPELRLQDDVNKQGSISGDVSDEQKLNYQTLFEEASHLYEGYKQTVDLGVAKEVARGAMPQNVMTTFVWKMDLHNFLKMVRLRIHPTAQKEIQELAQAMYDLIKPLFPLTCSAFEKHWLNSITLSADDLEYLKKKTENGFPIQHLSKRKQKAFLEKVKLLGLE